MVTTKPYGLRSILLKKPCTHICSRLLNYIVSKEESMSINTGYIQILDHTKNFSLTLNLIFFRMLISLRINSQITI